MICSLLSIVTSMLYCGCDDLNRTEYDSIRYSMFNPYKSVPVCCMCVITSHCYYVVSFFFLMLFEDGRMCVMAMQILVRYFEYAREPKLDSWLIQKPRWWLLCLWTRQEENAMSTCNVFRWAINMRFATIYSAISVAAYTTTRVDIADHREQLSSLF